MSVFSEAQPSKVLTKFVLVYPAGFVPSWFPPDYVPSSRIEDAEFRFGTIAPQVWDVEELNGQKWTVTEVQTYVPVAPSSIKALFVAVCTQDGVKPERSRKHQSILSIPAFTDSTFPLNEDGSVEYGVADSPDFVQFDWQPSMVQWFEPLNEQPDFRQVALCWCESATPIAA